MLMDRIIGAFTFRRQVYAEVENDTSFTSTAWILVIVVSLLSQLGTAATADSIGGWLLGAIGGTVAAIAGFALAAFVISTLGKALFQADVNFEEMVRTLGLAYVWNIIGVVGIVGGIIPALGCILTPLLCVVPILQFISWFFAAQEALDLDTGQTLITIVLGVIAQWILVAIVGAIMGAMGLAAAGVGSLLGGG
jgi:hypothetical protein